MNLNNYENETVEKEHNESLSKNPVKLVTSLPRWRIVFLLSTALAFIFSYIMFRIYELLGTGITLSFVGFALVTIPQFFILHFFILSNTLPHKFHPMSYFSLALIALGAIFIQLKIISELSVKSSGNDLLTNTTPVNSQVKEIKVGMETTVAKETDIYKINEKHKEMYNQLKNSDEYVKLSEDLLIDELDRSESNWENVKLDLQKVHVFVDTVVATAYKSSFQRKEHNLQRIACIKKVLNLKDGNSPFNANNFFAKNFNEIRALEKSHIADMANAFSSLKYIHAITGSLYNTEEKNLFELLSKKIASMPSNTTSVNIGGLKQDFFTAAKKLKSIDPGVSEQHTFKELLVLAKEHFTIEKTKKIAEIGSKISTGFGVSFSKFPLFDKPDDLSPEKYCWDLHDYLLKTTCEINSIVSTFERLVTDFKPRKIINS